MSMDPPRKWLMDRISGDSKYGSRERPWCPCCWVPPPVGWCPGLLEENSCCRLCGKCGSCSSEQSRFCYMHFSFMLNTIAMLMIVYASMSISNDYDILSKASFSKGALTRDEMDAGTLHLGLRGVGVSKSDIGEIVIGYDQLCDVDNLDFLMDQDDCEACHEMSLNWVISTMLAAICFVPSLLINITRMYSSYDVNCQKCFSGILSLLSIGLAINTVVTFKFFCADKFHQDSENGIDYEWSFGWAWSFMVAGICLKFLEMMINCCVPTPSITRERTEQITYESIKEVDE